RPRRPLRRPPARRACERGAQSDRRAAAPRMAPRSRSADAQRAPRRAACCGGPLEPRDRPPALRDPEDGPWAPLARVHEARNRTPRPALRRPYRRKDQGARPLAGEPPPGRSFGTHCSDRRRLTMTMTVREAFERGTETFNAHDLDGFGDVLAE